MKKKVTFVSLDVLPQVAPLAGGYLQGYACLDPDIKANVQFEQYVNMPQNVTPSQLTRQLINTESDVYAFSCYAWNMGHIKETLAELLKAKPEANYILGGPQVMNYAHKYLAREHENLVLCNGEGEKTFRHYLKELLCEKPDFARVDGLSFYRDGQQITNEEVPRIKDLDEIPSPILNGLLDPSRYTSFFLETNRGCPFTCYYCYWGGAIGAKVNKFSEERIREELSWIAKHRIYGLVIVDANWGILQRDVDLSRHLAQCKKEFGAPYVVGFSGSKNTPERVSEITKVFYDAGLLLNHTISLQTMQDTTLKMVGRQNIKTEAYLSMQDDLNSSGISSHIELIWPLPGETLNTFKEGIDQLCHADADMFFCHPLFLINNIELNNRREAYGLVTETSSVVGSEAEIVVQTNEVSYSEYVEGWRFMFATMLLHNLRSTYCLAKYLNQAGLETYGGLFSNFVSYLKAHNQLPLSTLLEEASNLKSVDAETLGRIAYYTHISRQDYDKLLFDFASSQPWWIDRTAQLLFEIDLLNRSYLYAPDIKVAPEPVHLIEVQEVHKDGYVIALPDDILQFVRDAIGAKASFHSNQIRVNHQQKQFPFNDAAGVQLRWLHCYHSAFTIVQISPDWNDAMPTGLGVTTSVSGQEFPSLPGAKSTADQRG